MDKHWHSGMTAEVGVGCEAGLASRQLAVEMRDRER
jgi:hypothetical protein